MIDDIFRGQKYQIRCNSYLYLQYSTNKVKKLTGKMQTNHRIGEQSDLY